MTLETVIKSELGREFEKAARSLKRQPADVLTELMAEYIETEIDVSLDTAIADSIAQDYTEADAVEIVRAYRRLPQK